MTGVRPQDRLAWHRQLTGDHGLSHIAIHVGLTISNYFNNGSGECFVGIERLAREAGVHGETARKAVSTLANRGHLRVKRGGGRGLANTYGMVVREPYPLPENTSRGAGVSEPIPQPTEPKNPSRSAGPTLKKRTLRKSNGFAMKKKASQPQPRTASAAPVADSAPTAAPSSRSDHHSGRHGCITTRRSATTAAPASCGIWPTAADRASGRKQQSGRRRTSLRETTARGQKAVADEGRKDDRAIARCHCRRTAEAYLSGVASA